MIIKSAFGFLWDLHVFVIARTRNCKMKPGTWFWLTDGFELDDRSIGDTRGYRYLDQEIRGVQHNFYGGPSGLVGLEEFSILLVIGRQVLPFG